MQIIIAILTGGLSFGNYMWQTGGNASLAVGIAAQAVLTVLTILALCTYGGKRTRRNYELGKPRIFTLGFAVLLVSTLGNVSVLVVFVLRQMGMIQGL